MTDITLAWQPNGAYADWIISGGTIGVGSDLQSAVILSLFTDRRATTAQTLAAGSTDPHGFWGDSYSDTPWGSRLWLLDRASSGGATSLPLQAIDYCKEALQWLIDDGVAASVDVTAAMLNGSALQFSVKITEPSGNAPVFQFSWAWASALQQGA